MSLTLTAAALVVEGVRAAGTPGPSPSALPQLDPERVTPGLLGLFFFLAFAVAAVFLYRSMSKQLSRIDFDESADPAGPDATTAPGTGDDQSAEGSERR